MNLEEVLHRIPVLEIIGNKDREISELIFDSRKAVEHSLYVAIKGTISDGHDFINSSIEKGAIAIVCEHIPTEIKTEITFIKVQDAAKTLGHLASNFYGNPSSRLNLIGITGTNGKTSVTTLLFDIFKILGFKSALISTVEYRIGDEVIPSTHTTPDIIRVNQILAKAVAKGCEYAFMEVSSHGIHQHRTTGLQFKIAGFTNITHDHLDYHKTFDQYLKTKKRFFD